MVVLLIPADLVGPNRRNHAMQNRYRLAWMWMAVLALAVPPAHAAPATSGPANPKGLEPAETIDEKPGDGVSPGGGGGGSGTQPGQDKAPPETKKEPGGLFGGNMLFIMIGVFILMYFLMSRGKRKQEKKRKSMLSELKKGDKITTIGGIVGTVIEVKEDEVTVKVDETNNIRMRFARWSIRGVGAGAKTENGDEKK